MNPAGVPGDVALASLLLKASGVGSAVSNPFGGVLGLIVLVIDILIIINIWKGHKALIPKVLWTLIVFFLVFVGWILYFFLGREK